MRAALPLLLLIAAPMLPHETLTTTVLFEREIVRILDKHCVMCHAAGGSAFPLETFDQTWLKKRDVHAQVIARHMPPWAAVPGYGQFVNDNSLTLRESQFIISWVEGLGPRNAGTVFLNVTGPEAARPPEIRAHSDFGHWQGGEPNLIRPVPAINIGMQATGIERQVIDLGLKSNRLVSRIEYMPGDHSVVRAAFFTIQETGQWIGSWTPWYGGSHLPDGMAFTLPAGAHVLAEIHYKGGKARLTEQGRLGIFFGNPAPAASKPARDLVLEAAAPNPKGRLRASATLLRETQILALWPQISPGVQSVEVSARKPDGSTEVLLFAKDFPEAWPTPYIVKSPSTLPRGTEVSITAYSTQPTARVRIIATRRESGR